MTASAQTIGVFDSGVGGLSILNALRQEMPAERFVYFADSAHAPYGERGDEYIIGRSRQIARMLLEQYRIKALVVACNTATAAAIHLLRSEFPELILVGVEPALKPASLLSRTGHIAVLGTSSTVRSQKFRSLHDSLKDRARFHTIACTGLADAIEQNDAARIGLLCQRYLHGLDFGTAAGQIDTLVLGCTHYPFVQEEMRKTTGPAIRYVETGLPVAQHTRNLLRQAGALGGQSPEHSPAATPLLELLSSGNAETLHSMARRYLRPLQEASCAGGAACSTLP